MQKYIVLPKQTKIKLHFGEVNCLIINGDILKKLPVGQNADSFWTILGLKLLASVQKVSLEFWPVERQAKLVPDILVVVVAGSFAEQRLHVF